MIEGVSIMVSLMIIIVVNSGNNYISEMRLADLVSLSEVQEVAVYRGSDQPVSIDASELVVGDVFKFEMGMKVPADCIMIEGQDVTCDESELTGEPHSVYKHVVTQANYNDGVLCTMVAKSLIVSGFGKGLVLAVGKRSVAGVITEKTQVANSPTLLQTKLDTIATKIGNVGIACAVLTFCAMLVRVLLEMASVLPCGCQNLFTCEEDPNCVTLSFALSMDNRLWTEFLNTFIIAITVIVVAIPEGLPLAVTISLSVSSKQMRKLNNLVRKIASSETMGSATHICSDKTGTLTLNKMTVMGCQLQGRIHMADSNTFHQLSAEVAAETSEDSFQHLTEAVLWNSTARIEKNDHTDPKLVGDWVTKGNVTEQGLLKFFMDKIGGQGVIEQRTKLTEENLLQILPFTSSRKRASVVVRYSEHAGTDKEVVVFTKGAPDMLFKLLAGVLNEDGEIAGPEDSAPFPEKLADAMIEEDESETHLSVMEKTIKFFACEAYRTLLICSRSMSMEDYESLKADNNDFEREEDKEILETDLVALSIFGL
jgi:Ca2+-transporting ATPase